MRNIILTALTVLVIAFTGCKKDTTTESTPTSTDFRDKIIGTYKVTSILSGKVSHFPSSSADTDTSVTQNNTLVVTKDEGISNGLILTENEAGKIPFSFKVTVTETSDKTGFNILIPGDGMAVFYQNYDRNNYRYMIAGTETLLGSRINGTGNYSQKTISYYYCTVGNNSDYYPIKFSNYSSAVKQ